MKRDLAFMITFSASDFGAAETPGNANFNTKSTLLHGDLNSTLHGATEGYTTLKLRSDILRDQLSIHIGIFNLDDVDLDLLTAGEITHFLREALNFLTAATDNNTWAGGVYGDTNTVPCPLDNDTGNRSLLKLLL